MYSLPTILSASSYFYNSKIMKIAIKKYNFWPKYLIWPNFGHLVSDEMVNTFTEQLRFKRQAGEEFVSEAPPDCRWQFNDQASGCSKRL
jgi:hypothetical protein